MIPQIIILLKLNRYSIHWIKFIIIILNINGNKWIKLMKCSDIIKLLENF